MQFMITYSFRSDARNAAQDRFKKTGGGPGAGVQMLNRWHAVRGGHGYVLAETNDAVALGKWMQDWTDLLEFHIEPVNSDQDVMKVLGA